MNDYEIIFSMLTRKLSDLYVEIQGEIDAYNKEVGEYAYNNRTRLSGFFPLIYTHKKNSSYIYLVWRFHFMLGNKTQRISEFVRSNKTKTPYTLNTFLRHKSSFKTNSGAAIVPKIDPWESAMIGNLEASLNDYRIQIKTLNTMIKSIKAIL